MLAGPMSNALDRERPLFPKQQLERTKSWLAESFPEGTDLQASPWPQLKGCLVIMFTSRTGSTFLAQEIERRFAISPIHEALNLPQIKSRAARYSCPNAEATLKHMVRMSTVDGWFGFKAGPRALLVAEAIGLTPAYFTCMNFALLIRRDIVQQAVSLFRAKRSGQYHSTQKPKQQVRSRDYSYAGIMTALKSIQASTSMLFRCQAKLKRRPILLSYESFSDGDFSSVESKLYAVGLSARGGRPPTRRAVDRLGDDINLDWARRFRREANGEAGLILDEYQDSILYLEGQ
jgi:trehalose 2-sulfotransferase